MSEIEKWAIEELKKHSSLAPIVENIIKSLLNKNSIEYFSVTSRVKEINSLKEKIDRKKYKNPTEELTDLSGLRIITFFESDIHKIIELIKNTFTIDEKTLVINQIISQ
ncbi:UNVERIFIED_ORG: ppGpp synthetase/RelA/SpoT-type nucleotidyltransferase [Comamonas terrigena]